MAASRKIRIMISSRCNDGFPAGTKGSPVLSVVRKELKREIEAQELFGEKRFEVWINEEAPPSGGTWDSWETCLNAVKDCDILLVLYNGNAGWAKTGGELGICHDELSTGYSTAPGKIRLITLGEIACDTSATGQRNKRFQAYVATQSPFRGGEVKAVEELKQRVREALADAVTALAQSGVREASKGRFYSGQALDWSRLDFTQRHERIVDVLRDSLLHRGGAVEEKGHLFIPVSGCEVLFLAQAVPASLSVPAAREMVGQPFLKDHLAEPFLIGRRGGPVHLIGCHKSVTETQATRLLGFPDATVVTTPFGVYVADNIQKIQLVLIANCRDESNTRHGVQRFFEWLEQTGEGDLLSVRAAARARIVKAIAKEFAKKD